MELFNTISFHIFSFDRFIAFWSYGHMADSLVSTPVVGFVPFMSGRSHI